MLCRKNGSFCTTVEELMNSRRPLEEDTPKGKETTEKESVNRLNIIVLLLVFFF